MFLTHLKLKGMKNKICMRSYWCPLKNHNDSWKYLNIRELLRKIESEILEFVPL